MRISMHASIILDPRKKWSGSARKVVQPQSAIKRHTEIREEAIDLHRFLTGPQFMESDYQQEEEISGIFKFQSRNSQNLNLLSLY